MYVYIHIHKYIHTHICCVYTPYSMVLHVTHMTSTLQGSSCHFVVIIDTNVDFTLYQAYNLQTRSELGQSHISQNEI